jgi:hypothetical protein
VGLVMLGIGVVVESLLPTGIGVGMRMGTVVVGQRDVGCRLCLLRRRGSGRGELTILTTFDDFDDIDGINA